MQPATPASAWQSISRETENVTMVGAVPAILPRPCRWKKSQGSVDEGIAAVQRAGVVVATRPRQHAVVDGLLLLLWGAQAHAAVVDGRVLVQAHVVGLAPVHALVVHEQAVLVQHVHDGDAVGPQPDGRHVQLGTG